jgi:hypothetical protein
MINYVDSMDRIFFGERELTGEVKMRNLNLVKFIIKKLNLALLLTILLTLPASILAQDDVIDFESDRWTLYGAQVVDHLGQKSLRGSAVLKEVQFENGVIEVDVAFEGSRCFAGFIFRLKSLLNYEEFYLRPHKTNLPDALQYTPVFNGLSGWQMYSGGGFTAQAAIPHKRWVHLKMEISGTQAKVYLDNSQKPLLVVNDLKHGLGKGLIGLKGPNNGLAHFANFKYRHDDSLSFEPAPKVETLPGMITEWEISQAFSVTNINKELSPETQELGDIKWQKVTGEASGLVDIARHVRKMGAVADCVLARTTVHSEKEELKKLTFGYSDEVSIFLNGKILFRGNSEFRRRDPGFTGIVGLHDSVFLPLHQGENELLLMVTEAFGGWGFITQLGPLQGLSVLQHEAVTKRWESPPTYQMPESACYDKIREVVYITNFGGDFISKVDLNGKIIEFKWISGLERPTGAALFKNTLYVVTRKNLVEVDVESGKIFKKHLIPEAKFPNDVAIDPSGDAFISDSQRNVIYKFKSGEFEIWMEGDEIKDPNGLFIEKGRLIFGNSGDGCFKAVSLADKQINTLLCVGRGSIMDGIRPDGEGNYLIGDWNGRLFLLFRSGEKIELLNSIEAKLNLADFEFVKEKNLLIIPTLGGNRVLAYEINIE